MSDDYDISDVESVVRLSSSESVPCQCCDAFLDGDLDEGINHYLQDHSYTLLHVGTETSHGPEGGLWHDTIAILSE